MSGFVIDEIRSKMDSFDNYSPVSPQPTTYTLPKITTSLEIENKVEDTSIFTTIFSTIDSIIGEGKSKFVIPAVIFIILGVGYLLYKKNKDKKNNTLDTQELSDKDESIKDIKDDEEVMKKLTEQINIANEKPKTNKTNLL